MQIIPTVYVPLDPAGTALAVERVFSVPGQVAPKNMVRVLCAWIWFETNGHVPGFGVGNISAAGFVNGEEISHWDGPAWRPPWFEEPGDGATDRNRTLHQAMLEGHAPSAFRAYASLDLGLADWRALLAHRFPKMLAGAASGDVHAVAEGYTAYAADANPAEIESALNGRLAELDGKGAFVGLSGPIAIPPSGGGSLVPLAVVGAVVASLAVWASKKGWFS